jgi:hypothetical protein
MKVSSLIFLLVLTVSTSCEEIFIKKDLEDNPVENFDFLWSELDKKYSFFDFKNIDWDSVYQVYRPKVDNSMTREELFNVMADMLNTLRDGHVNLRSEFNISKYEGWFLNYPANFDRELVLHNYLGTDYKITGPFLHREIDGVGYVRYGSFQSPVTDEQLDYVLKSYQNAKGIILDIRANEGGNPNNGFKILERLIPDKRLVYRHAFKSGPQHNEFEPLHDVYLEPTTDLVKFNKKVVVLTNRQVYSAANYFSAICKVYGITLVGDQTGGGGGVPAGSELPNGFHVNYSSSICLLPGGYNIEAGIPPDVHVDMTLSAEAMGKDGIIETALDLF